MKRIFVLLTLLVILSAPQTSFAAGINTSCPNIYGVSCPSGNIAIDKKIKNPQTGELVETLGANNPNFLPNQEVFFRVEVKNTGNIDLNNIQVQDKLPEFVDFVDGPGNFDKNSRNLNWTIDKLTPGQSRFFDVKVKVKTEKDLPKSGITCITNFAEAKKDSMSAQDTAAFCIQTKVLGTVSELPKTGLNDTNIILTWSIFLLISSFIIFQKVKKI